MHSGPEPERHGFDARVSERDLVDTYLPAFRAAVVEGKADSIMCVYNAVNGTPGCASADLLQKRLRDEWGFKGYVVSDCGAVSDIFRGHEYAPTLGGAAVAAVKAGTDLTCGTEYRSLVDEVKAGRISEAEIDRALRAAVRRARAPGHVRPAGAGAVLADPDLGERLGRAPGAGPRGAARKAIVLLKNEGGLLPLAASVRAIAVLGPSADDPVALLGNYNGISSKQVTPLEGIERQFPGARGALRARRDVHGQHPRARAVRLPRAPGRRARGARRVLRQPRPPGRAEAPAERAARLLRHGDGDPAVSGGRRAREVLDALDGDA